MQPWRGVIHSWAQPGGKQRVEDKGSFGQERQRNLEWEVVAESRRFIRDAVAADKPFRGEKGMGAYEGGFKVPMMVKWPGVIRAGSVTAEFMAMEDWLPTIMAQLGKPDMTQELLGSYKAGDRSYSRIHLDGYDQTPMITATGPTRRKQFYHFTETTLHGVRYGDWKFLFKTREEWFNGIQQNMVTPLVTNLELDPFERFHEARGFDEWQENRAWTYAPAFAQAGKFMQSLKDYPPRSASVNFDIDQAMQDLTPSTGQ